MLCSQAQKVTGKVHNIFITFNSNSTCWLARVDYIHCLLNHYRSVCEALKQYRRDHVVKSASDANSFLKHYHWLKVDAMLKTI